VDFLAFIGMLLCLPFFILALNTRARGLPLALTILAAIGLFGAQYLYARHFFLAGATVMLSSIAVLASSHSLTLLNRRRAASSPIGPRPKAGSR
jgi:hypothetical protein